MGTEGRRTARPFLTCYLLTPSSCQPCWVWMSFLNVASEPRGLKFKITPGPADSTNSRLFPHLKAAWRAGVEASGQEKHWGRHWQWHVCTRMRCSPASGGAVPETRPEQQQGDTVRAGQGAKESRGRRKGGEGAGRRRVEG